VARILNFAGEVRTGAIFRWQVDTGYHVMNAVGNGFCCISQRARRDTACFWEISESVFLQEVMLHGAEMVREWFEAIFAVVGGCGQNSISSCL
jgi:hypothetical protein